MLQGIEKANDEPYVAGGRVTKRLENNCTLSNGHGDTFTCVDYSAAFIEDILLSPD